jgi:hypothetical protein
MLLRLALMSLFLRYENMLLCPILDNILYNVQRQGKISFYVRLSPNHFILS